jgi:hypothetical protein
VQPGLHRSCVLGILGLGKRQVQLGDGLDCLKQILCVDTYLGAQLAEDASFLVTLSKLQLTIGVILFYNGHGFDEQLAR